MLYQGILLLVGLPLALLGTLVWFLPYKSPRASLSLYKPAYEAVASLKLGTALLAFPLTYAIYLAGAWWFAGLRALIVAAVLLPLLGLSRSVGATAGRWCARMRSFSGIRSAGAHCGASCWRRGAW